MASSGYEDYQQDNQLNSHGLKAVAIEVLKWSLYPIPCSNNILTLFQFKFFILFPIWIYCFSRIG